MQEITKIRLNVTEEFGVEVWHKFRNSYRYAKERCCNPNCKDYPRYSGMWNFADTVEYYNTCFNEFLLGLDKYGLDDLSIDRKDSKIPYQPGNIRFVSMKENLRNKPNVKPLKLTNKETGEVVYFPSFFSISKEKLDRRFSSTGVHGAYKRNALYKGVWQVEFNKD
ncbi:hypothetical protein [Vibrio phage JSF12]|uniref:Uncharacterized protein n=3 Tax=Jesfedecavirus TaxID=2560156 RepID=A0A2D0YLS2_9CAUD|nr:hypothetical protein AVV29_gp118 [Vibrio phage phi 3]YP_009618453.1 hypothetical protein FDI98_gp106 [Vibrio phage JSF10]YP_009794685.1 hypothetical protein HOS35_gp002 [Vibrio phage JSF12]AJF40860.1 hypothetical protein SBVP3_0093 [Vibrio phage phi 3]ASV43426.1 hypothetical protein [Vibrio phage JSF10]ASV43520.1 hypothetical protein [Vibrio phage JSF12]